MSYVLGCDISDFQSVTSFHEARAAGLGFVICKATQALHNVQDTFHDYAGRVRATGMVLGAYHFLDWHDDPAAQAAHFLSVYTPRNGDLPPTLDCEACDVDSATAIAQVSGFVQAVEPHLAGARMLLYMSYSFPADHLNGGSGFDGHPLWVAAYNSDPFESNVPPPWPIERVKLWQYSDAVRVPGIGNVDGDRFIGTPDDLADFTLTGL